MIPIIPRTGPPPHFLVVALQSKPRHVYSVQGISSPRHTSGRVPTTLRVPVHTALDWYAGRIKRRDTAGPGKSRAHPPWYWSFWSFWKYGSRGKVIIIYCTSNAHRYLLSGDGNGEEGGRPPKPPQPPPIVVHSSLSPQTDTDKDTGMGNRCMYNTRRCRFFNVQYLPGPDPDRSAVRVLRRILMCILPRLCLSFFFFSFSPSFFIQ
jgi:hypothetical protein